MEDLDTDGKIIL